MEKRIETLSLTKTNRGYPAIWERGGGMRNTGKARIIAGENGEVLTPIYIRRRGNLALGEHALFPALAGMVVVSAYHHHGDFYIEIKKIVAIKPLGVEWGAEVEVIATHEQGEWDNEDIASMYKDAINAAKAKALHYHCRVPYYIKDKENE